MRVLHDKILVERSKATETKRGALFVVTEQDVEPATGIVLMTGPGLRDFSGNLYPVGVVEGDFIQFAEHAGTEVELEGKTFLVIRETDVVAVL